MIELSGTHNIPVRTLHDWKKNFINLVLPDWIIWIVKIAVYVTAMWERIGGFALLKPKLKIRATYQKIILLVKQASQKPPSYTTVYNVVRKIKPALLGDLILIWG